MNKIVRDQYPVRNLPDDLREGLEGQETVRVVIELEMSASEALTAPGSFPDAPRSAAATLEMIRKYKAEGRPSVSADEAVARIRALRDEWDD